MKVNSNGCDGNLQEEEDTMRREYEAYYELNRGYQIYIVTTERDNRYSIELDKGSRIVAKLSTGCIGMKSANYWLDYNKQVIERLIFLANGIDMACYSINLLMNTPCEELHKEINKLKMLHRWFKDIVDGLSEPKRQQIIDEFSEYYNK